MKEYCFAQGWAGGFVNVNDLQDLYTERWSGLAIQCLVDLHKAGVVDVRAELDTAIEYQYAMITGSYSGEVIGAPMHSMDGHECSGDCPDRRYWMFSPWMGSSFLIPSLWEYYVFVDKDPRIAQMIVMYGDALMKHGVVRPAVWTNGQRSAREWMLSENPTAWISLYFGNPYNLEQAIVDQDADGWYSDLHNPEAIFALSAAYFFSCNESFKTRVDEMWGFFNQENADNGSPLRIFLWQHRGSASTEWLLENAACSESSPTASQATPVPTRTPLSTPKPTTAKPSPKPTTAKPSPNPTTAKPSPSPTRNISPVSPRPTPRPTSAPEPNQGFTNVRSNIPETNSLDGIYVPMSARIGDRWLFLKRQYQNWFSSCAPGNVNNGGRRGGNTAECWRYDPMKTLYEFARRAQLVGDPLPDALVDARQTTQEFLNRQDFTGSMGGFPDCDGGVSNMPDVDKCDMKYWGHASGAWVSAEIVVKYFSQTSSTVVACVWL